MKRYEVTIIGGGIAGLATAEIFARSGFSVCLVDKNEKLCMEASGMHHEWFHFGSLYSIFPNNQYLKTMVGGIDDLLNYYRDFRGMNIRVDGKGKLVTIPITNSWIRQDNLKYVISSTDDGDFSLKNCKSIRDIPYKILMNISWNKVIKQFVARHNRFYKYDWRKGCSSHYIPKAGWLDYSKEHLHEFSMNDVNLSSKTHSYMDSYDSPMTAANIISDLTKSFISNGGEIKTCSEVKSYSKTSNEFEINFKGGDGIKSDKLIIAASKGIEKVVKNKVKIKSVASPLLVVYPTVCDANIVRLTPFMDKTINHLHHKTDGKEYSLIGGGYFAPVDDESEKKRVAEKLLKQAIEVFPKIKNSTLREVYFGIKTEVVTSVKERNYLYHITEIENNVHLIVPGKFSLAFSLAVNTYLKIMGHYPNTFVDYDETTDISEYLSLSGHRFIIDNITENMF
jgi:hypothetical protein